ncbi:UNVERIFIED_CONTAM: hypothetical protein Cloal_2301 [Acetivibrio alkalicellulosi]
MKKLIIIPIVIILTVICIYIIDNVNEVKIKVDGGYIYGNILNASRSKNDTIVIITAGSGPTDRDGNTPILQGRNDSLKQLAYGLKDKGISSLRYDQRPSGKTYESLDNKNIEFDHLVDDLVECIRYIKEKEKYKNIYLIGHSQGTLISILAAQQESVDGVIAIAGTLRTIDKIFIEQFENQGYDNADIVREQFEALEEGREIETDDPWINSIFSGVNGQFLRRWMEYDPVMEIKKLDTPLQLIFGTSDIQVKPVEINFLGDIIENSNYKILEDMNHVLKVSPEDQKENLKRYYDPAYPLHPDLVGSIIEFIAT